MSAPQDTAPGALRWVRWAVVVIAATIGGAYSFDFGLRLNGPWLGVVTAANGALICWVMAGALVDALERWMRGARSKESDR
jgi:hypothetical protein